MEDNIFFEHYRVCTDAAGSREEIGRSGAAIVYKGVDVRSNEAVALQLIPLASIDPIKREQFEERARSAQKLDHVNIARVLAVGVENDFIALVSEFLEGEMMDAWVVANGPMPIDAVLRVGLQVVRALGAAAYHGLTHRALQPSNIIIIPGQAPDGGWPFVKLLNFGLAGAASYSTDVSGRTLAPAIAPQFASPEQLHDRPLDFRSEIYSLGATMCFLLTGTTPVTDGTKSGQRSRHLPELRRVPRALRRLLNAMLSEKPENRPQDPVAVEDELRKFLTKFERHQSVLRNLGIPTVATLPRSTLAATPAVQIFRGAVAFVVLVLVGAAFASVLYPNAGFFHLSRRPKNIGVPIGVPDSKVTAVTQTSPPANSTNPNPGPTVLARNQPAPLESPVTNTGTTSQIATARLNREPTVVASNQPGGIESPAAIVPNAPWQIAASSSQPEPQPPAQGPNVDSFAGSTAQSQTHVSDSASNESVTDSSPKISEDSEDAVASESRSKTKPRTPASRRSRLAKPSSDEPEARRQGRPRVRSFHAQLIGMTADGRPILRLPSGRIVIPAPGVPVEDPSLRRRVINRPPDFDDPRAPRQPFVYPPGPGD